MSKEINYGRYKTLDSLKKLFEIDERLKKQRNEDYLSGLGSAFLYLDESNFRYFITPPDLITFVSTGGDGIHFGFFTDFGSVEDLNQAPIVCVSPTNDPPIKLVARNLVEFLSILCMVKDADKIDNANFYRTNKDYMDYIKNYEVDLKMDEKRLENLQLALEELHRTFDIVEIPSLFDYWEQINKERALTISMKTLDRLGVRTLKHIDCIPYDFNNREIAAMKSYLFNCSYTEKLGFIRDAFFRFVLGLKSDLEVRNLLLEEMKKEGLWDEAARLESIGVF